MFIKDPINNLIFDTPEDPDAKFIFTIRYKKEFAGILEDLEYLPRYPKNPVQDGFLLYQKGFSVIVTQYDKGKFTNLNFFWTDGQDIDINKIRIIVSYKDDGFDMMRLFKIEK